MKLTIDDVTVTYHHTVAVDHVGWQLSEGFHALLGPNGAGKSSLMRTLVTLQKPSSGTVSLDGLSGNQMRPRLGYCPQENLGKSRLTVHQHLAYMCWLHKISKAATASEADRVLDVIDLTDRADDRISSLSGGMRRRVAIGSALIGSPDLVVLDEPSAGLDVAQREELTRILGRVAGQAITIVSTHIFEDVLEHADTVTVMDHGRFKFQGPFDRFTDQRDLAAVRARYMNIVES